MLVNNTLKMLVCNDSVALFRQRYLMVHVRMYMYISYNTVYNYIIIDLDVCWSLKQSDIVQIISWLSDAREHCCTNRRTCLPNS